MGGGKQLLLGLLRSSLPKGPDPFAPSTDFIDPDLSGTKPDLSLRDYTGNEAFRPSGQIAFRRRWSSSAFWLSPNRR